MVNISGKDFVPDVIDPMKGRCPVCGNKLILKKLKKQKNGYRRGVRSWECVDCGYAEYDSNPREEGIIEGHFDDEL